MLLRACARTGHPGTAEERASLGPGYGDHLNMRKLFAKLAECLNAFLLRPCQTVNDEVDRDLSDMLNRLPSVRSLHNGEAAINKKVSQKFANPRVAVHNQDGCCGATRRGFHHQGSY